MAGFIYIFSNPSLEGLKIGKTKSDPAERARELSTTSVPSPFKVEYFAFVDDHDRVETDVHAKLGRFRKAKNREFFNCADTIAIDAIRAVAGAKIRFEEITKVQEQAVAKKKAIAEEEKARLRKAEEEKRRIENEKRARRKKVEEEKRRIENEKRARRKKVEESREARLGKAEDEEKRIEIERLERIRQNKRAFRANVKESKNLVDIYLLFLVDLTDEGWGLPAFFVCFTLVLPTQFLFFVFAGVRLDLDGWLLWTFWGTVFGFFLLPVIGEYRLEKYRVDSK